MNACVQCGMSIPDGQRTCSMCYGDIAHGSDGYYEQWARAQQAEAVPPCDICGGDAVASENGFNVCSEGCAAEAKVRVPTEEEASDG